ncbi:MAG: FixH family protein [Ktedonobacterales bacterium]
MAPIHRWSTIGRSVLLLTFACLLLAACSGSGGGTTPASGGTAGFHTTVKTADLQYVIQFSLTPNRLGLNTFEVKVADATSGQSVSSLQVHLATTMLDMDMGTDQLGLSQDGPGQYSGQGTLAMSGHWEIQILFHTPDTILHQAAVKLDVAP